MQMHEDLNYGLIISPGSGWNGANWLLVFRIRLAPEGGGADRGKFDRTKGSNSKILDSFRTREEAEETRDQMFRDLILQAAQLGPSSERR